ncbi:RNase adapter protein RapZ [Mariprofundus micogutta]|uniref:RNase adapter protein RapZ n=1 Tax=Mariprofundus micogutta TaxID=1921010 RepID=A0A1L8CNI1_9PROT|nr:RNase adapter RapZ [Mariprofundus micogutta]GAV20476.1 RNase adapter protein RapZ [Mariprofundus micogutta]
MILISGLSGAGKSTVLHALEDAGFFCTDNLPLELLSDWSNSMLARKQPAAVCLDSRSGFTAKAIRAAIKDIPSHDQWQLLFVEAEDEVLRRRFSTVKRRHPFPAGSDLMESIRLERESLLAIRNMADLVLDSSHLTPYELAEKVDIFCLKPGKKKRQMICNIISFSYKNGLPANADIVFDMRFLPNPHYQPELAPLTGCDQGVISFLESYEDVKEAALHIQRWLAFTWPLVRKERKQYLTIAMGCSGGRHRSVYMAELISGWLNSQGWAEPTVQHRELGISHSSIIDVSPEAK